MMERLHAQFRAWSGTVCSGSGRSTFVESGSSRPMNTPRPASMDCATELAAERDNNARLREHVAKLTFENEALMRSRSWRLTAPLRKMAAALYFLRRSVGPDEGLAARLLQSAPTRTASEPVVPREVEAQPAFDGEWYLAAYPDVAQTGMDPLEHYLTRGKESGCYPTPSAMELAIGFDRNWYLETNPDIALAKLDPFLHWFNFGRFEGRHSNASYSFTPGQCAVLAKSYHYRRDSRNPPTPQAQYELSPPHVEDAFDSAQYWSERYRTGGHSGAGSYGRLAGFKAEIINTFVREHDIALVMEFGCGDGAQLSLADYPAYVGFDVADESVELCRSKFAEDSSKQFRPVAEWGGERADLVLSLDVIYHLIEDDVFHDYMCRLFRASGRYVIIYSSNHEELHARHVKHRRFTDWVEVYQSDFRLVRHVPNRWPLIDDGQTQSFADFYIFEKIPVRKHKLPGHLVVSLTSYASRFPTLELTLRRILQQSVQPDETVLWLTEEDKARAPGGVLALEMCGLTIRVSKELLSYKKIIPALEQYPHSFILTFDDDIAYPLNAVEQFEAAFKSPSEIVCRRAHKPAYDDAGRLRQYSHWQFDTLDESGPDLFPTGSAGVLYPPRSLASEAVDERVFMTLAPQADDVWLFWMGRIAGSTVRRAAASRFLQPWPDSQENGLWSVVNAHGGNDRVIDCLAARYGFPASGGGMHERISGGPGGSASPLSTLLQRFVWSSSSAQRNETKYRGQPVQPFLFLALTHAAETTMVFDIGTNIGVYSLLSTTVPTVRCVHALETDQAALGDLHYNILANRLEGTVTARYLARSEYDTFATVSMAVLMQGNRDQALALRIDAEHFDYDLLVGSRSLLIDNRCVIQIKVTSNADRIIHFLAEIGYRQIFRAGADHYFSNNTVFLDPAFVLDKVGNAVDEFSRIGLDH